MCLHARLQKKQIKQEVFGFSSGFYLDTFYSHVISKLYRFAIVGHFPELSYKTCNVILPKRCHFKSLYRDQRKKRVALPDKNKKSYTNLAVESFTNNDQIVKYLPIIVFVVFFSIVKLDNISQM